MAKKDKRKIGSVYILFVSTGVILWWRGIWGLADIYMFPDNPSMSFIASSIIGLIILFVTHKLQRLVEEFI